MSNREAWIKWCADIQVLATASVVGYNIYEDTYIIDNERANELLRFIEPSIRIVACKHARNPADADDIAQVMLLTVYKCLCKHGHKTGNGLPFATNIPRIYRYARSCVYRTNHDKYIKARQIYIDAARDRDENWEYILGYESQCDYYAVMTEYDARMERTSKSVRTTASRNYERKVRALAGCVAPVAKPGTPYSKRRNNEDWMEHRREMGKNYYERNKERLREESKKRRKLIREKAGIDAGRTRTCRICGLEKPEDAFIRGKGNHRVTCNACAELAVPAAGTAAINMNSPRINP